MKTSNIIIESDDADWKPWHIRDPQKIRDLLAIRHIKGVRVNKDATVTITAETLSLSSPFLFAKDVSNMTDLALIFKIRSCRNIEIGSANLSDISGLPKTINGFMVLQSNKLYSLAQLPTLIGGHLNLTLPNLKSFDNNTTVKGVLVFNEFDMDNLSNIHKNFPKITSTFALGARAAMKLKSHILGLMLINELKGITPRQKIDDRGKRTFDALEIIDRHLRGERDILDCQEDLIKAGLREFARI